MRKLSDLDRAVLRASLKTCGQAEIAKATGASKNQVTHSLLKLRKSGAITLTRRGQSHEAKPTPTVAAALMALARLEEAIQAVLECTLKSEAA